MESMKKNILIVTTVSGFVPQFEMNNVRILQSMGYTIHYAANFNTPVYTDNNDRLIGTGIIQHQVDFVRSPFSLQNIKAYRQLRKIITSGDFTLIHCHTPMGGVLGRIAGCKTKHTKMVYTAHGFHFYTGAPLKNWLLFYPVERILAKMTDVLITINDEDYSRASKFKLRNDGSVKMIPGVGIDTRKKIEVERLTKESVLHLDENQFVITSIGELSQRKNHEIILRAMPEIINIEKHVVYVICGSGELESRLKKLTHDLNIEQNVIFMGYCKEVYKILAVTDCFVFPSKQEGLPVAVLEAMSAGLPVICSNIRGNHDLIDEELGGHLINNDSLKSYVECILDVISNQNKRRRFAKYNREKAKQYDQTNVIHNMKKIYEELLL